MNFVSAFFAFVLVALYLKRANSECVSKDSCFDPLTNEEKNPGDSYRGEGCSTCTCEETKRKIITCYRKSETKFPGLFYWRHYYINIPKRHAKTVKCPYGMTEVTDEETVYAMFYLTYVKVGRVSRCCNGAPRVTTFCKAVVQGDGCSYRVVLKSNQKLPCPFYH